MHDLHKLQGAVRRFIPDALQGRADQRLHALLPGDAEEPAANVGEGHRLQTQLLNCFVAFLEGSLQRSYLVVLAPAPDRQGNVQDLFSVFEVSRVGVDHVAGLQLAALADDELRFLRDFLEAGLAHDRRVAVR